MILVSYHMFLGSRNRMSTSLSISDRLLATYIGLLYMTSVDLRKISRILITHHYDGHQVIRRNDRLWADLSTDLIND